MADAVDPANVRPPFQRGARAVVTGLVATVALAIAGPSLSAATDARYGTALVVTVGLLLTLVLSTRLHAVVDRALAPVALLPAAPVVAWLATLDIAHPVATLPGGFVYRPDDFVAHDDFFRLEPIILPLFMTVAAVAGLALAASFPVRIGGVVRVLAWPATLGAVVLLIVAQRRPASPSPERYFATLPVVARLPALDDDAPQSVTAGAIDLRRSRGIAGTCLMTLTDPELTRPLLMREAPCGVLAVRVDRAHALLILDAGRRRRAAHDLTRLDDTFELRPDRIADAIAIPVAFVPLSLIGVVGAIAVLTLGRRRPPRTDTLRDAVTRADGVVWLRDEPTPAPLAPGLRPEEGYAVAELATPPASFRDRAGPVVVRMRPGTLDEHHLAAGIGPHAFALVFVTIASTPLLTALLYLR